MSRGVLGADVRTGVDGLMNECGGISTMGIAALINSGGAATTTTPPRPAELQAAPTSVVIIL